MIVRRGYCLARAQLQRPSCCNDIHMPTRGERVATTIWAHAYAAPRCPSDKPLLKLNYGDELVFTFDFAPARLSLQLSTDTSASMASARLWNYTSDAHPQSTEMLRRGKNRMPLENIHTGTVSWISS